MSRKNEKGSIGTGLVAIAIVLLLVAAPLFTFYKTVGTHRNETFTINKTERIMDGRDSKYLVYTSSGVFENTDSLLNGKFNSSDVYNELKDNQKYTCDVVGWRVPFLSWYPNIIKCQEEK